MSSFRSILDLLLTKSGHDLYKRGFWALAEEKYATIFSNGHFLVVHYVNLTFKIFSKNHCFYAQKFKVRILNFSENWIFGHNLRFSYSVKNISFLATRTNSVNCFSELDPALIYYNKIRVAIQQNFKNVLEISNICLIILQKLKQLF